jgi:hypothetical protein
VIPEERKDYRFYVFQLENSLKVSREERRGIFVEMQERREELTFSSFLRDVCGAYRTFFLVGAFAVTAAT